MASHIILDNFYKSQIWIDFRHLTIAQRTTPEGTYCEHCGNIIEDEQQITLHHVKELTPENVNDRMISLNPDNVIIVHHRCHDEIHHRFGQGKKHVYLVYGPPLSGKKTYIRDHAMHNDIVVDIDVLFNAITINDLYNKPNSLLANVRVIHDALLDNIKTRYGKWSNAYIIGGYADKYKRDKIIQDLGAEPIYIAASRDECISRLRSDSKRLHRIDEWIGYIDKWFDEYRC